jgi:kumamolisin
MPTERKKIPGSAKKALPNAKAVGEVNKDQVITLTVVLRRKNSAFLNRALTADQPLTREQFAAELGADPSDIEAVERFAQQHNLTVTEIHASSRTIKLSGTIKNLSELFKPKLKEYKAGQMRYRGRVGDLWVPEELAGIVEAVLGFDDRPVARTQFRRRTDRAAGREDQRIKFGPRNALDGSLSPLEIAKLYDFPTDLDGSGQCVGIIELGGGFSASDLKTYFAELGVPNPSVVAVGVDGGRNAPGQDADAEVMLDIEVVGAVAPKAKIAVYFAPNTDQGFVDAVLAAVHDNRRKPSVISISWGAPEDLSWTQQALNAFNSALQDAAALGVTVCCAAGDDGSSDIRDPKQRDGKPHVDFPAASPFALACGGTKLIGTGGTIQSETVWNEGLQHGATGGGVSTTFGLPDYQANISVPKSPKGTAGRGVPDVAGNADPLTGYRVRVNGKNTVIGGTSAVSPLWAGLIALINQRRSASGKAAVGFLHPVLYANAGAFRDITDGNNDIDGTLKKYASGQGWDACTGLGSPDAAKLLKLLD